MPARKGPRPDSPATDEGAKLWDALSAFNRGLHGRLRHTLRAHDLTPPQFWLLQCVYHHGSLPAGKLSTWLHVTLPTVTGIVDHLEKSGFVSRSVDSRDRRMVVIALTAKGTRTMVAVHRDHLALGRDLGKLVPPSERAALIRALEIMTGQLLPDHRDCKVCDGQRHRD